jgi:hypothetical protein
MSAAKMVNMISYTKHIDFQVAKRGPSEKKVSEAKEYLDNLLEPPQEKEFNSDLEDRVLPLALENALRQNGFKLVCSRRPPSKYPESAEQKKIRWHRGSAASVSAARNGLEARLLQHIEMRRKYTPALGPVEVRNLIMQTTSKVEVTWLMERSEQAAQETGVKQQKLQRRRSQTFAVTVSSGVYHIESEEQSSPRLSAGCTYTFDQSHSSNSGWPLRFSTSVHGTHYGGVQYATNVMYAGVPGNVGAYTYIVVDSCTPAELYYYCTMGDGKMGNHIPMLVAADSGMHLMLARDDPMENGTEVNVYTNADGKGKYRVARVRGHETRRSSNGRVKWTRYHVDYDIWADENPLSNTLRQLGIKPRQPGCTYNTAEMRQSEQGKAHELEREYRELQQEIEGLRAQLQCKDDHENVRAQCAEDKWREMGWRLGCLHAIGTYAIYVFAHKPSIDRRTRDSS